MNMWAIIDRETRVTESKQNKLEKDQKNELEKLSFQVKKNNFFANFTFGIKQFLVKFSCSLVNCVGTSA